MSDILDREFKKFKDSGGNILKELNVKKTRRYGRVLANTQNGLAVTRWAIAAGIKQVYEGWAIELILSSDPGNRVTKRDRMEFNLPCDLLRPRLVSGEHGSRFRHRYPRLVLEVQSTFLNRRTKQLKRQGFRNMYDFPFVVFKEDPDENDLEKALTAKASLPESITITKEIWQEWR